MNPSCIQWSLRFAIRKWGSALKQPRRRVLVIFNPTAGRGRRRRLERALSRLSEHRIEFELRETQAVGDAAAHARESTGFDIVAVAGGDGTINEAANGLVACGGPTVASLAIIPLGTANVLAAEIGFKNMSPEYAADAIALGEPVGAYVGVANGRVFCQMAGVGFDAQVVENVDPRIKRRLGKLAYVLETLRLLVRYRPEFYSVSVDGEERLASSAIVANGHYYAGRYTCAPTATIDRPEFQVCLFGKAGRLHVIRYSWGLLTGRLHKFCDVTVAPARSLSVSAVSAEWSDGPVQGDGDVIARLPADIVVSPVRLNFMRPER